MPIALRARALVTLSWMTVVTGSQEHYHQLARDQSEQAFALAEQLGDNDFTIQALVIRSHTWVDLERRDLGFEYASAALDLARSIDSPRRIAEALAAVVYAHDSPFELPAESRAHTLEALAIFRQLSDSYYESTMLVLLAFSHFETLQDVREARALYEEALELAEEIGSNFHRLLLWTNSGVFSLLLGEFDLAVQQSQRALRLARRSGSPVGFEYWNIFTLACCATQQGHFLVGAQLTGAHDGFEDRAIEPLGGWWPLLEIMARENNRVMLRDALGDKEYDRLLSIGKGLSTDRVYELALGGMSHVE